MNARRRMVILQPLHRQPIPAKDALERATSKVAARDARRWRPWRARWPRVEARGSSPAQPSRSPTGLLGSSPPRCRSTRHSA